ncbi:MAG: hypothetical protein J6S75_14780 [Thermoguttaceae bacterium]|nr:hypothetical protein [Thermoguttaceae bacterium]
MLVVLAIRMPGDVTDSVLELIIWLLLFIAFLILGALLLKRLRAGAKGELPGDTSFGGLDSYEQMLREGLISFDEFEMIRRNLRDQMVHEIYAEEKYQKAKDKAKKQRRPADDRESRLEALLRSERR